MHNGPESEPLRHDAEDEPLLEGQTVSKAPALWQRFVDWILP